MFSLYLVDLCCVVGIPSLGGRKYGLLVVSENENFKRYNIALIALRDNLIIVVVRNIMFIVIFYLFLQLEL
jgi:hypothetical protein